MRRLVLLLFVVFLVNLPLVSQQLTERKLARHGEDVVATVLDTSRRNGHNYVDYRLPAGVDPHGTRYSAMVDDPTFEEAQASHELPVRVVPGSPSTNQPAGVGRNQTFLVVALLGDAVLVAIGVLWWRRYRRWNRFELLAVEPGEVTLRGTAGTVVAAAPEAWSSRVVAGPAAFGRLHLAAEQDLYPGPPLLGLEQVAGARYVARGRVVDTQAGWALLELADGFRLRVETGPHRIRADIRDSTEAVGVLCFTPR